MARLLIAIVGALAITVVLLFGMLEVTNEFRERDPTRYFMVDFIEAPDRGRERPTLAPAPELPPERMRPQFDSTDATLEIDRLDIEDSSDLTLPAAVPDLDSTNVAPD